MIKSTITRQFISRPLPTIQKRLLSQAAFDMDIEEEPPVLVETNNNTRTIVLNRPKQLNSLNSPMFDIMFPRLKAWENSNKVNLILLKSQGRAFCSGGDIKFVASTVKHPSRKYELDYFIDVMYDIFHFIGTMQTPIVSLMNGITFGAGCGVGVFSHFSVATENTKMSMPETRFGHFCDAGSSFYLSRLNGHMGRYIALCSKTLVAEDTLFSGLATHFVPARNLGYLEDSLINLEEPNYNSINNTIEKFSVKPGHIPVSNTLHGENRKIIEQCFKFDTLQEIIRALEKEGSRFSLETIDQINKGSPLAAAVTLEYLKRGSKMTLIECLRMEHIGWQTSPYHLDFYNGIVSTVINKQKPKWSIPNSSLINMEEDIEINYFYANARRRLNFFSEEKDCYSTLQCREYGLPSEKEVNLAKSHFNLKTDQEIISWFINNRCNKYGVQQEVEQIIHSKYPDISIIENKPILSKLITQ